MFEIFSRILIHKLSKLYNRLSLNSNFISPFDNDLFNNRLNNQLPLRELILFHRVLFRNNHQNSNLVQLHKIIIIIK